MYTYEDLARDINKQPVGFRRQGVQVGLNTGAVMAYGLKRDATVEDQAGEALLIETTV